MFSVSKGVLGEIKYVDFVLVIFYLGVNFRDIW